MWCERPQLGQHRGGCHLWGPATASPHRASRFVPSPLVCQSPPSFPGESEAGRVFRKAPHNVSVAVVFHVTFEDRRVRVTERHHRLLQGEKRPQFRGPGGSRGLLVPFKKKSAYSWVISAFPCSRNSSLH